MNHFEAINMRAKLLEEAHRAESARKLKRIQRMDLIERTLLALCDHALDCDNSWVSSFDDIRKCREELLRDAE